MNDDAQRRPYGSFDPADVLDPSRALVPSTVRVNEVRVKQGFWPKIRRVGAKVPFAKEALSAYFATRDKDTPLRTKGIIMAGLAYFVLPTDVIPDFLAGFGFTDDAAVLMMMLSMVSSSIKPKHKAEAEAELRKLQDD
jgi:uncharacterized membrane protein YkvA (DUF1232 family)